MTSNGRLPRVLCIEDDVDLRDSLVSVLAKLPARVEGAANGDAAVELMLASDREFDPYSLLIVDMQVPLHERSEVDTTCDRKILEFLNQQRDLHILPPGTPIVVFTADPNIEEGIECIRRGAVDYLPKMDANTRGLTTGKLFERCKDLLQPSTKSDDDLRRWIAFHGDSVLTDHGACCVALANAESASRLGLTDRLVDGFAVVFAADEYMSARERILRNPLWRWESLHLIRFGDETSRSLEESFDGEHV